LLRIPSEY
jgi:hypothetical protein